jgi:AraC-like DNA-binding protein
MVDLNAAVVVAPAPSLRRIISHYWLSRDMYQKTYVALPDGVVDLVFETDGTRVQGWVYGTPTSRTDIFLTPGRRYLGIRFRPGQSRHVMRAAARELTDSHESVAGLLDLTLEAAPDHLAQDDIINYLDAQFITYLSKHPPKFSRIDAAIAAIDQTHGIIRVSEVAAYFARSRRQFERAFLEVVGLSPKTYMMIRRFEHAVTLLAAQGKLVEVAIDAGYSDQSHMTNDFRRLSGLSPAEFARTMSHFYKTVP